MKLSIDQVGKEYRGGVWGIRDFSLEAGAGLLGLLGPNGAGKSTLMRMLATITRPTCGRVLWDSGDVARDPDRLRSLLGYLPQDFGVYPHLTAVEFLEYMAAVKGLERRAARRRIDELLQAVNLTEVRARRLGGFSGGMRQRVGIAQALLNDPELLILDEPTAGLDPEERVRLRNLLSDLSGERIVILSTHIVSDVEAVATEIAIVAGGRLVSQGPPETLLEAVEGKVWECVIPSAALPAVKERHIVSGAVRRADGIHARIVADECPQPDGRPAAPSLEDAYLLAIAHARAGNVPGSASRTSATAARA